MKQVYFDTWFYIWLATRDASVGARVVQELTRLSVVPVVSPVLVRELTMNPSPTVAARNADLFRLLSAWTNPAAVGPCVGNWNFLLLGALHRLLSPGHSQADLARLVAVDGRKGRVPPVSLERQAELRSEAEASLAQVGDLLAAMKPLWSAMAPELDHHLGGDGRFDELFQALMEGDFAALPDWCVQQIERENSVDDAAFRTHAAAKLHEDGTIEPAGRKTLNTARDAQHFMVLLDHADHIDLMLCDGPQFRLARDDKHHPLKARGLWGKVRPAPSRLEDVPRAVADALAELA